MHKVGIIGVGMIAHMHAKAIGDIENAQVVACLDINSERSEAFATQYNCTGYSDITQFLAHPDMSVVTICTPSGLHLDSALLAAQAKKHLIIEKPIEITTSRCNQIIEEAHKNNVKVCGIFPSRFHSVAGVIKKAIDDGRFGNIVLADAYVKWYRSKEYYESSPWKGTWKLDGGGALMNQSIHAIDLLGWFMGKVDSVTAHVGTITHKSIEVEDTAVAILRFANGALGVIEGSTAAYPGFYKRIEISGSCGSVIMGEENISCWKFEEEKSEDEDIRKRFSNSTQTGGGASDPSAIGYHGHKLQFINFFDSIDNDSTSLVDGVEAAKAVTLIEAIYESAKSGKMVTLD